MIYSPDDTGYFRTLEDNEVLKDFGAKRNPEGVDGYDDFDDPATIGRELGIIP